MTENDLAKFKQSMADLQAACDGASDALGDARVHKENCPKHPDYIQWISERAPGGIIDLGTMECTCDRVVVYRSVLDAHTCPACRQADGATCDVGKLPPHPNCTSENGCRCTVAVQDA